VKGNTKKKKRSSPRKCESCNCDGGFPRMIEGVVVQMCDDCEPSEFRRRRVLDRRCVVALEDACRVFAAKG